jgi:hypothetical protein
VSASCSRESAGFRLAAYDNVHPAIPVEIAERCTAVESRSRHLHNGERPIPPNKEYYIRLAGSGIRSQFGVVFRMTGGGKNILVPIVIEVVDSRAPAAQRETEAGHTRQLRNVYELPILYIPKDREGLVRDGGHDDVVQSVIIEVAEIQARRRIGSTPESVNTIFKYEMGAATLERRLTTCKNSWLGRLTLFQTVA